MIKRDVTNENLIAQTAKAKTKQFFRPKWTTLLLLFSFLLSGCVGAASLTSTWDMTGSMNLARDFHTATLISDGRVLVSGGVDNTAEIYDMATGMWDFTGSMNVTRRNHTATLLQNGLVLVVGGSDEFNIRLTSAELYDPATGIWINTGSLNFARSNHSATLLQNGKVLVVGGDNGFPNFPTSVELYDPATGFWSNAGNLNTGRYFHRATLLHDGQVLVTGGYSVDNLNNGISLETVELYNPATGMWSMVSSMSIPRDSHTATIMSNGNVLVAGGDYSDGMGGLFRLDSAEVFNPVSGMWMTVGSMSGERAAHEAIAFPNGQVLVVGGISCCAGLANAELFDPFTGMWSSGGSMNEGRAYLHEVVLLPNLDILVVGGDDTTFAPTAAAEVFDSGFATGQPVYEDFVADFVGRVNNPVRYEDIYNAYADESEFIIRHDPFLFREGTGVLDAGYSLGISLMFRGGDAVITADQMNKLDSFLDHFKDAASPELQATMETEGDRLPPYEDFVGMTVSEAVDVLIASTFDEHKAYLPILQR